MVQPQQPRLGLRHASANDDKCNANDCTNYSPAKWKANNCTADYSPAK